MADVTSEMERDRNRVSFDERWREPVARNPERFQAERDGEGRIVSVLDADTGRLYLPAGWVA